MTDASRPDEQVVVTTLGALDCDDVGMLSIVVVGSVVELREERTHRHAAGIRAVTSIDRHPIEVESYRIMYERVDFSMWPPGQREVVARMVHATADESFATSARIGADALPAARGRAAGWRTDRRRLGDGRRRRAPSRDDVSARRDRRPRRPVRHEVRPRSSLRRSVTRSEPCGSSAMRRRRSPRCSRCTNGATSFRPS